MKVENAGKTTMGISQIIISTGTAKYHPITTDFIEALLQITVNALRVTVTHFGSCRRFQLVPERNSSMVQESS
ncbi:MAG: hypothetical protein ACYCQJ_13125 [Nitrososphaerales archaeon]